MLTAFGRTQTAKAWSIELGIPQSTIAKRRKAGLRGAACLVVRIPNCNRGKTWEQIYSVSEVRRRSRQIAGLNAKPRSPQHCANLSNSLKRRFAAGIPNTFQGRRLTCQHRQRISEARRRRFGAAASVNRLIRNSQKYKNWRTSIYVRDDYTCQRCHNRGGRLNVHHRVELWQLLVGKTFEQAMRSRRVWDKTNAETVCIACHKQIPVTLVRGLP